MSNTKLKKSILDINKAGYTARQSQTGGQEWKTLKIRNVTDLLSFFPTDTASSRVACPRLKIRYVQFSEAIPIPIKPASRQWQRMRRDVRGRPYCTTICRTPHDMGHKILEKNVRKA